MDEETGGPNPKQISIRKPGPGSSPIQCSSDNSVKVPSAATRVKVRVSSPPSTPPECGVISQWSSRYGIKGVHYEPAHGLTTLNKRQEGKTSDHTNLVESSFQSSGSYQSTVSSSCGESGKARDACETGYLGFESSKDREGKGRSRINITLHIHQRNRKAELELFSDDSVETLMEAAEASAGLPMESLHLMFQDRRITAQRGRNLEAEGLKAGSSIHVVSCPRSNSMAQLWFLLEKDVVAASKTILASKVDGSPVRSEQQARVLRSELKRAVERVMIAMRKSKDAAHLVRTFVDAGAVAAIVDLLASSDDSDAECGADSLRIFTVPASSTKSIELQQQCLPIILDAWWLLRGRIPGCQLYATQTHAGCAYNNCRTAISRLLHQRALQQQRAAQPLQSSSSPPSHLADKGVKVSGSFPIAQTSVPSAVPFKAVGGVEMDVPHLLLIRFVLEATGRLKSGFVEATSSYKRFLSSSSMSLSSEHAQPSPRLSHNGPLTCSSSELSVPSSLPHPTSPSAFRTTSSSTTSATSSFSPAMSSPSSSFSFDPSSFITATDVDGFSHVLSFLCQNPSFLSFKYFQSESNQRSLSSPHPFSQAERKRKSDNEGQRIEKGESKRSSLYTTSASSLSRVYSRAVALSGSESSLVQRGSESCTGTSAGGTDRESGDMGTGLRHGDEKKGCDLDHSGEVCSEKEISEDLVSEMFRTVLPGLLKELEGSMAEIFKAICSSENDIEKTFQKDASDSHPVLERAATLLPEKFRTGLGCLLSALHHAACASKSFKNVFRMFISRAKGPLNGLFCASPVTPGGDFYWLLQQKNLLTWQSRKKWVQWVLPRPQNDYRDKLFLEIVRGDGALEVAFNCILYADPRVLRSGLDVRFAEESAAGPGVLREFLSLLTAQLFDPNFALFEATPKDRKMFHLSSWSRLNPDSHAFLRFCGRLLVLALAHDISIGIKLSPLLFHLLSLPATSPLSSPPCFSLAHLKDVDPVMFSSCQQLLLLPSEEVADLGLYFCTDLKDFDGETRSIDLCLNGSSRLVEASDRDEFVHRLIEARFVGPVREEAAALRAGLEDLLLDGMDLPQMLEPLHCSDLNRLLYGEDADVDVSDWRRHTEYHGYEDEDDQIQWFWAVVGEMTSMQRRRLLFFATAIWNLPSNGFAGLSTRFHLHRAEVGSFHLPTAHTCFHQFLLPPYPSLALLRMRLIAVTEEHVVHGFGFI